MLKINGLRESRHLTCEKLTNRPARYLLKSMSARKAAILKGERASDILERKSYKYKKDV